MLVLQNKPHRTIADIKFSDQFPVFVSKNTLGPNFIGDFLRYFSASISNALSLPVFRNHICGISTRLRSEQMLRVAAKPIVAFVANEMSGWRLAFRKLVSNPMRFHISLSHNTVLAISSTKARPQPWPTFVFSSFRYTSPERGCLGVGEINNWFWGNIHYAL